MSDSDIPDTDPAPPDQLQVLEGALQWREDALVHQRILMKHTQEEIAWLRKAIARCKS